MKLKITTKQLEKLTSILNDQIIMEDNLTKSYFIRECTITRVIEMYENMKLLNSIQNKLTDGEEYFKQVDL